MEGHSHREGKKPCPPTALHSDCGCLRSSPKCQTHVSNYRGLPWAEASWLLPVSPPRRITELSATPPQVRAVTYAAAGNKPRSCKETRVQVREGRAVR